MKNRHQAQPENLDPAQQPDGPVSGAEAETAAGQTPVNEQDGIVTSDETSERLSKAEDELKELSDRHMRLMAEYDNFRRRTQKEREALYTDSVVTVVKEWLPVVDNLDRAEQAALAAHGESAKRIAEGVLMILKQAGETLKRLNVSEIDCLGKPFDPNLADAVLHVEDDSVGPSTVIEVLQKGYVRDERVIRHCIVKVAN